MTENINSWNFWPILSCIIFGQEKHCGNLFTNNAFPFQKECMESMETIKQNISLLIKSDNSYVELSFWRRLKLRFSSRLQRRHERETECADLLKEAFENLDEALSYVAQMRKKKYNTATFVFNLSSLKSNKYTISYFSHFKSFLLYFIQKQIIWFAK